MKKTALIFILIINGVNLWSQNNSPYTFFGLGQFNENHYAFNKMMGMSGSAYADTAIGNVMNPAALSSLKNTVLQTSVSLGFNRLNVDNENQYYNDAWMGYFSLSFPLISERLGASFGIRPLSTVNYKIIDSTFQQSIGDVVYKYEGSGRLYSSYINLGLELLPEKVRRKHSLSIGLNLNYLFGYLEKQVQTEFNDTAYFLNSRKVEGLYLSDVYASYGVRYQTSFKETEQEAYKLALSYAFDQGKPIRVKRDVYWDRYTYYGNMILVKDTVSIDLKEEGLLDYPKGQHFGLSLQKRSKGQSNRTNEWMLAVDYKSRQWSNYTYYEQNPMLQDNYLISFGGFVKPASAKKAKPKTYYFGVYKGLSMLEFNGEHIEKFGMSFGLGIPFRKLPGKGDQSSQLNLGLTLGKEGKQSENIIEQSFIEINLGVIMNSRWFRKRKFN